MFSIASLRANTGVVSPLWVDGYYGYADGGEGHFVYVATDTTSADNGGTIVVDAAGQRWYRAGADVLTTKQFGAKADGATNDTAAITAWLAAVMACGKPGYISPGTHITTGITIDLGPVATKGIALYGAGPGISVIYTGSSGVLIKCSQNGGAAFYSTFRDFGITADSSGIALQVGQENFADAMNEFQFDNILVQNGGTAATTTAVEFNEVCNASCFLIANAGGEGTGTALRLRQTTFSRFEGSFGNANIGINFTQGYSYGNVFNAIDVEVVDVAVQSDSVDVQKNVFVGGTYVYASAMCVANQLSPHLYFISPNANPYTGGLPEVTGAAAANVVINA